MSHDEDLYAPFADDRFCGDLPLWARDEDDTEEDESEDES